MLCSFQLGSNSPKPVTRMKWSIWYLICGLQRSSWQNKWKSQNSRFPPHILVVLSVHNVPVSQACPVPCSVVLNLLCLSWFFFSKDGRMVTTEMWKAVLKPCGWWIVSACCTPVCSPCWFCVPVCAIHLQMLKPFIAHTVFWLMSVYQYREADHDCHQKRKHMVLMVRGNNYLIHFLRLYPF